MRIHPEWIADRFADRCARLGRLESLERGLCLRAGDGLAYVHSSSCIISMRSENNSRFYYPELDGLRFIAFLLVFIHNAPSVSSSKTWTLLHDYGWIGVDLFFCLSGFLITRLLVTEYQHNGTIH